MVWTSISSGMVDVIIDLDNGCLMLKDNDLNKEFKLCFDKSGNFEVFVNGISQGTAIDAEFFSKILGKPTEEEEKLKDKIFAQIKGEKEFIAYIMFELLKVLVTCGNKI